MSNFKDMFTPEAMLEKYRESTPPELREHLEAMGRMDAEQAIVLLAYIHAHTLSILEEMLDRMEDAGESVDGIKMYEVTPGRKH